MALDGYCMHRFTAGLCHHFWNCWNWNPDVGILLDFKGSFKLRARSRFSAVPSVSIATLSANSILHQRSLLQLKSKHNQASKKLNRNKRKKCVLIEKEVRPGWVLKQDFAQGSLFHSPRKIKSFKLLTSPSDEEKTGKITSKFRFLCELWRSQGLGH